MFACEDEGVTPDIICLSKSLSAGVIPIGAFVTTPEVWDRAYGSIETALLHTSTFGGNTFACVAGLVAIELALTRKVADNAGEMGALLLSGLHELAERHALINAVRGKGLLIGIEFTELRGTLDKLTRGLASQLSREYAAALVAGELMNKNRIVTAYTISNPNVIRIEPPLIVSRNHVDALLQALDDTLTRNKSVLGLAVNTSKTVIKSLLARKRTEETRRSRTKL